MQKAIEPVTVWYNGQTDEAVVLNLISTGDNLQNAASFYYSLLGAAPVTTPIEGATDPTPTPAMGGATLTQGNLDLGPDQYAEWDGSNAWILDWAAAQLNLTFVPGAEII